MIITISLNLSTSIDTCICWSYLKLIQCCKYKFFANKCLVIYLIMSLWIAIKIKYLIHCNGINLAGFLDHVTVLIGISVKGNAVAGVVHQPWFNFEKPGLPLGRCIWGVIGLGGHSLWNNFLWINAPKNHDPYFP